jgi:hypothetical protein
MSAFPVPQAKKNGTSPDTTGIKSEDEGRNNDDQRTADSNGTDRGTGR